MGPQPGRAPRARSGSASPTTPRTRSATSSTCRCPRWATPSTGGATCGELESTKSVSDIYAPVTGEVVARNEALDATPELVNSDPYGGGWLFEIVPADAGAADGLLDAAAYQASLDVLIVANAGRAACAGLIGSDQPSTSTLQVRVEPRSDSPRRDESMPFCTACGRQNPDDARFCSQCGTQLVGRRRRRRSRPASRPRRSASGSARDKTETSDRRAEPGRRRRGRRAARRATRCWSCSAVRAPAAGSCSTPTWSTPGATPTARSSSTT